MHSPSGRLCTKYRLSRPIGTRNLPVKRICKLETPRKKEEDLKGRSEATERGDKGVDKEALYFQKLILKLSTRRLVAKVYDLLPRMGVIDFHSVEW